MGPFFHNFRLDPAVETGPDDGTMTTIDCKKWEEEGRVTYGEIVVLRV